MAQHNSPSPPENTKWLLELLSAKFFGTCETHIGERKKETNIYCMTCQLSICQHCLFHHSGHKAVQIRRYVYHDVVRLHDINKLVDCSGVQPYTINSARVVFLNERPQPRPTKNHNSCHTCDRSLQEDYQFCSMGCKVSAANKGHASWPNHNFSSTETQSPAKLRSDSEASDADVAIPFRTQSVDGSSGLSDDYATSGDEAASPGSVSPIVPKRSRHEMGRAPYTSLEPYASPKSVLPEMSPINSPSKRPTDLLQSFGQNFEVSTSKRRKSPPHRSPAF